LEDLEAEEVEYESAEEFLGEIKKEFGGEDEESMKVVELKRIEQGSRIIICARFQESSKREWIQEMPTD